MLRWLDPSVQPQTVANRQSQGVWGTFSSLVLINFISTTTAVMATAIRGPGEAPPFTRRNAARIVTAIGMLASSATAYWGPNLFGVALNGWMNSSMRDSALFLWFNEVNQYSKQLSTDTYSKFQTAMLGYAQMTSVDSVRVLEFAKIRGFESNYYDIRGYFGSNNREKYYGALAYHVEDSDISVAALETRQDDAPIHLYLSNTTGGLAVYAIHMEDTNAINPYINVDVSGSSADSANRFIVANKHAIIHGGESLDVYELLAALDTVQDPQHAGKALAGYIVDGLGDNKGLDLVSFSLAQEGQTIHAGAGFYGLVSYQGIYNFTGSEYVDYFTRYSTLAQDDDWVNYAGGGGKDWFDLRNGNNSVLLDGGGVTLRAMDKPGFAPQCSPENREMYTNHMSDTNKNTVSWVVSDDASQWFEVYGNERAKDSVSLVSTVRDQGVKLSNYAHDTPIAERTTAISFDGYLLQRYTNGAAISPLGFFDTHTDYFYGTLYSDLITLDGSSKLKEVNGMGGADQIYVNVADIKVTGGGANSLVSLGRSSTNAKVYANAGNSVLVSGAADVKVYADDNSSDTATFVDLQQAANAIANVGMGSTVTVYQAKTEPAMENTVNIDWFGEDADFVGEVFNVKPDDVGVTKVSVINKRSDYYNNDHPASAGKLVINAKDGFAKVEMGGSTAEGAAQATRINVGTKMDYLWVVADQANKLFLDLYFDNPDVVDTVNDLQSLGANGADGMEGKLTRSAFDTTTKMYTYTGTWQHGNTSTRLSITSADADPQTSNIALHFGTGSNAQTVKLSSLV
jgi:hypothetical protein